MSRLQTPASCQDDRYYAQPYSLDAVGFSFTSLADYQTQARNHEDRFGQPVEEYELQYLDGDHHQLFGALGISQATLAAWFALLEALDGDEDRYLIACHLAEDGCPIDELANRWADYHLYHGTAVEVVAECYQLPDKLEAYLDYEKLGRDMVFEGSIVELEHYVLLIGG
ncbi:MAG: hypothetical protein NXH88_05150 [Hyphomonas sp.]|nr:hypothetical protein [Hyphomonas sp.]